MKEALRSDPRLPPPPLWGRRRAATLQRLYLSRKVRSKYGLFARYSC